MLELMAYNTQGSKNEANNVYISLQVNIISRITLNQENKVILSKVFHITIPRNDNSVQTIVPAASSGLSQLADKILIEIQNAIAMDKMKTENN